MFEKIKKNWKIIVISILVLFSLNKCTVSCNRQGIIDEQQIKIELQDSIINDKESIIKNQNDTILYWKNEYEHAVDKGTAVSDAHLQGEDYLNYRIKQMSLEINSLKNNVSKLQNKNNKLQKTISKLTIENDSLKSIKK